MNSTDNLTISPSLAWIVQLAFDNVFHSKSFVQTFRSAQQIRAGINILFLVTEIGGLLCNFYLMIRVCCFLHSMQHVKSQYRSIIFYNQYTHTNVGLSFHLAVVGVLSCSLILSSHIYLIHFVNNNQQLITPKVDSMTLCSYVPFLRDALSNVYVYILLTLMVLYRRADIRSFSKRNKQHQQSNLIKRRQHAKMVLLHSLPWVMSLGLSLPRGLLDMRLDFRSRNPHKIMETSLAEELCLHRSNDADIVHLCMWALQACIPVILCTSLVIIYSLKDQRSISNLNRNRRSSNTTLGDKVNDPVLYSSSKTLYSLHNYKEEVIKLLKSSPVAFYSILLVTLFLRFPFTIVLLIDDCHMLLHSTFVFHQILVIVMKNVEYLHLAILPFFLLHSIISLVSNSIRINGIRRKVKKLTETDEFLKNSMHRYDDENSDADDSEKPFMLSTV